MIKDENKYIERLTTILREKVKGTVIVERFSYIEIKIINNNFHFGYELSWNDVYNLPLCIIVNQIITAYKSHILNLYFHEV